MTNLKRCIYHPTNSTGTIIIKAGNSLGVVINTYLDHTMAMFNVNDTEMYKLTKLYANIECTKYDVNCDTLSCNCLTQIAYLISTNSYTKKKKNSNRHTYLH